MARRPSIKVNDSQEDSIQPVTTLRELREVTKDRFLPALAHSDFRFMWLGHVAGESASWALVAAEAWLIFTLAKDNPSSWVGMVMLAAMLPWFVVPIIVGFLADRFVRRNILIWAYAISLLHGLILTLLVFTGTIQVWHIVVLAFVNGSARATHMGGIESLAANLVPGRELANAYTLINAGYYATRLIGPGVIAPLLGVVHFGWIFLIAVGLYLVGLCLTFQIRTVSTGVMETGRSILYNTFSGFKYVYRHRVLRSIIFLVLFHCTLVMSFETLLPALSKDRLGAGGSGVAYLHMMVGFGSLLVLVGLAPLRGEGLRGRVFLMTGVISGVSNIALGMAPTLPLAMLSVAIIGVSHTGFMTMATIMIQSTTPDGLRGRVTSIYLIHAGGFMSFAYLTNGALADSFDPRWILTIGGLAFLGVMFVSMVGATPRRLYLTGVSAQAGATSG